MTNFNEVVELGDFIVLDTETTGLHDGEICQIAIVDALGNVLLDTYVKPVLGIPADATRIHGITNEMVANAPGFPDVVGEIHKLVFARSVLVYNAVYDRKMLHKSAEHAGINKIDWKTFSNWFCVMEAYAKFYGDWNDYHQSYRWQSLTNACHQQDILVLDAHSALGDCLMTLTLVNKVWRQTLKQS